MKGKGEEECILEKDVVRARDRDASMVLNESVNRGELLFPDAVLTGRVVTHHLEVLHIVAASAYTYIYK